MHASPVGRLVARVATRLHLVSYCSRFVLFTLCAAGVYAAALAASKLLGVIPDVFHLWTVLIVPAVAAVLALVLYRRPTPSDAAHAIDDRMRTKDLFLTATLLDNTPGEYQPVVASEAVKAAPSIRPATVVPYRFSGRAGQALVAVVVLGAATLLPQFDPLGLREEEKLQEQRREQLAQLIKQTESRKEQLLRRETPEREKSAIDKTIEQLAATFRQMKPEKKIENRQKLRQEQLKVGDMLRTAEERRKAEQGLRDAMKQMQRMGALSPEMKEMVSDLKAGDATTMKQKLEELQEKMEQLAEAKTPEEKQQLQQEIMQGMQQMQNAMEQVGSEQMKQAMQNAMQQMQMAGMEGMQSEAMQAAMESMQLAQMEAEQLADMLQNEQALKEAMEALQKAMQANEQEALDGEKCDSAQAMAEYAKAFEEMMKGQGGQGQGQDGMADGQGGMGGPGQGEGGIAEEKPDEAMAHQDEFVDPQLQPGKILMEIKSKELSHSGELNAEYQQAMKSLRQQTSEAVLSDDVPPGYREAIMRYTERLDPSGPPAAGD